MNRSTTNTLRNKVITYIFEQECGELSKATPAEIEFIKKVPGVLASIAKKNGVTLNVRVG